MLDVEDGGNVRDRAVSLSDAEWVSLAPVSDGVTRAESDSSPVEETVRVADVVPVAVVLPSEADADGVGCDADPPESDDVEDGDVDGLCAAAAPAKQPSATSNVTMKKRARHIGRR
jgi:hypothetical protein